jgi:hypothetical protein
MSVGEVCVDGRQNFRGEYNLYCLGHRGRIKRINFSCFADGNSVFVQEIGIRKRDFELISLERENGEAPDIQSNRIREEGHGPGPGVQAVCNGHRFTKTLDAQRSELFVGIQVPEDGAGIFDAVSVNLLRSPTFNLFLTLALDEAHETRISLEVLS